MSAITVELRVPDLDSARDFYLQLGFSEAWRDTREGSHYLVMQYEATSLAFRLHEHPHPYFGEIPSGKLGRKLGWGVELVISAKNLEEIYSQALKTGRVVDELQERRWGLRDFRIADPFGYYLRITEPRDVLSENYGGRPPKA